VTKVLCRLAFRPSLANVLVETYGLQIFPPQPRHRFGVKALMDQPISLRIVELEALLELREAYARQISDVATDFSDPRVQQECERAASQVHEELRSIQQELGELLVDFARRTEFQTDSCSWMSCRNTRTYEA